MSQLSFTGLGPSWITGTVSDLAKAIFSFSVNPTGSSRQASPLCFSANLARQQNGLGRRSSRKTRSYSVIMGYLPSSILMMPEKSLGPPPALTNMLKSCAASAPIGVLAPDVCDACWASFRSFSMLSAVKPAW